MFISLCFRDDAIADVPCFNERLTCAAERLQAFCQENEIPEPSAPRVHHEYGDTPLVVLLEGALLLERLQWTRDDADRHQE